MSHRFGPSSRFPGAEKGLEIEVRTQAAAFYVACIKNGFFDEATEFAEWYLDTFDHDLED